MKNTNLKSVIAAMLVLATSCNEPETIVTDIVHTDGSITRKIEMKSSEKKFRISEVQVPYDSTWSVRDSVEINNKGDTIRVRRAEKFFRDADEINKDFRSDSSYNKNISRSVSFRRKFKWFHTEYRFAEQIDKKMQDGYPVSDFLNSAELSWFYSPDNVKESDKNGPDSLRYKALEDSVNKNTNRWTTRNFISEWINEFAALTNEGGKKGLPADTLKKHEDEFVKLVEHLDDKFDSLWKNGLILKEMIGEENAKKYENEADSAMDVVTSRVFVDFNEYTQKILMPGKVTETNGFVDQNNTLLWPVKSDFFLTQPYIMQAESKVPNRWAWVVSGLFLVFVVTGIIIKQKGKG
ncbi:MAG: hypothetical protein Q8868_11250 [Bacteroidota bacterium]|nr:hypothetical protein [Bacteroidota bacterium]